MKKSVFKSLIGVAMATMVLGGAFGVASNVDKEPAKAEAAAQRATGVYVEDQQSGNYRVLSIESITFNTASGYSRSDWEAFLTEEYGARKSYDTTKASTFPTTKGWSYLNSETSKYLICPNGSNSTFNFEMPNWVTDVSFKIVGNNYSSWLGDPVRIHSGWQWGYYLNIYVNNTQLYFATGSTEYYKDWGDVSYTAKAVSGGSVIETIDSFSSPKYYLPAYAYNMFGYTFGGWYKEQSLTNKAAIVTSSTLQLFAKQTLNKVAFLSGTMNGWNASDDNYLMMPAENSQYRIVTALAKDVEFKVVLNNGWHGWSQVDQSSNVVKNGSIVQGNDPDTTGFRIKVAVAGTYEIYIKTTVDTNKIWIQQDSVTEAKAYAVEFLTTITCSGQGSVTFQINKWNKVGSETISMEYKFEQLTQGAKHLMDGTTSTSDTDILNARERYDEVLGKHGYGTEPGQYHDFMGRKPAPRGVINPAIRDLTNGNVNNSNIWIIVISVITVAGVSAFFFLKKRKEDK